MKYLLLLLLLIPQFVFGAVAHDASGTGATGASSSLSYSHTVTGSNPLIICGVSYVPGGGTPAAVSSVIYDVGGTNTALTLKSTQVTNTVNAKLEMWFLAGPATGAHTVQVNFTGDVPDRAAFDCTSFSGAASLGTAATGPDVVTGLACTVPVNGLCYDVGFNIQGNSGCQARTPSGGTPTKRYDICDDGGVGASVEHFSATRASSGTMAWDHDSGPWEGQISVPINPFVSGGGPTTRKRVVVVQ